MGIVGAGSERGRAAQAVLHFAVAALSSLLVVVLAGLVLVKLRPSWLVGLRNAIPSAPPAPTRLAPRPAQTPNAARPGRPSFSVLAPTLVGPSVAPGAPVLSALQPATGGAGDTVTVVGTNLFSTDGTVLVSFGGRAAHTRCPTERVCLVTVPAEHSGQRATSVQVRTASGLSNPLPFRYR